MPTLLLAMVPKSWRLWLAGAGVLVVVALVIYGRGRHDEHAKMIPQLNTARQALQISQDGQTACRAQLGRQNASIEALSAASASKLAASEKALAGSRAVVESLRRSAVALRAYKPRGSDVCAQWQDADAKVTEVLR